MICLGELPQLLSIKEQQLLLHIPVSVDSSKPHGSVRETSKLQQPPKERKVAVSYTHLTLPTNHRV